MKTKRLLSLALAIVLVLSCVPIMVITAEAADAVSMMVSYAQARVGKTGQQLGYTTEWCAYFVCDCATYAGQSKAIPYNGNAHYLYFAVLDAGGKVVSSPQSGDLVFYNCTACDTNGDGISMMHVGLVENSNYSIEGNLDGSSYSTRTVKRKGINERYSHGSGHSTDNYVERVYVRPAYSGDTSHACDKGTYVYYEAAHPHYKCYRCSVCGEIWRNTQEPTIVSSCSSCVPQKTVDSRYSSYYPIGAFPLSTGRISVYDASGNLYSNRYIDGATDVCLIWEIYTDGWCKVRYPSSVEESGYFDAYVPLSVFTAASSPSTWTATSDYTTYRRSDLSSTMSKVSSGTTGLLLSTNGSVRQIIHPVSGYDYSMMGWISDPKQIHISDDSLSLTLGGTESKVIYAWSTGSYNGNTALYFSRSNSNISCSWGEWTNGKAPLTITANAEGTTTLTIGVRDSDSKEVLDSTTITVAVNANTYSISYNANGGSGAPSSQTKSHGTDISLSGTIPTRFGYNFSGWATSSSATSATYQPGDTYSSNSSTTLYAVWNTPKEISNDFGEGTVTLPILYPNVGCYLKFVPSVSTKYRISGIDDLDTKVYLYDASGKQLATDDDSGTENQFQLDYLFTAGETYYIYVRFYSRTATGNLVFILLRGYALSYNANGGSNAPSTTYKYCGVNTTISSVVPYRIGYTFLGWSTNPLATSASYQPGSTFSKNADTTLYAVWQKGCSGSHSYTVTVTAPTCTAQGYTAHTCSVCGDSYVDSYVNPLGHEYKNGICTLCGAEDPDYVSYIRLAGSNRYDTAIQVADEMKEVLDIEKFDAVILANGYNFADALAGSYLSTVKDAPILLTWNGAEKYNYLNDATIEYVKNNLKPGGTVYILGGTSAVPVSIDARLSEFQVHRMAGANRFETNIMILEEAGIPAGSEILVCTSSNFADSLSASATGKPILLVWNDRGILYGDQPKFLEELQAKGCTFTVIGGESAVSGKMAATVGEYGEVDRLAGANRFETSVQVAEKYFPEAESAVLAYAWDFPDGLCGGGLANAMNAPLILTMTRYEAQAADYIQRQGIKSGIVLGGEGLISAASVAKIFGN